MAKSPFNYKLIEELKGRDFVRDLRQAEAIKETWGYAHLKEAYPALCGHYNEAKKLPTEPEKPKSEYLDHEIADSPDIPKKIKDSYQFIQDFLKLENLVPLKGLYYNKDFKSKKPSWYAWDTGLNGVWFTQRKTTAAVNKDSVEGFWHSTVRTYVNRIKRGEPLYSAQ